MKHSIRKLKIGSFIKKSHEKQPHQFIIYSDMAYYWLTRLDWLRYINWIFIIIIELIINFYNQIIITDF